MHCALVAQVIPAHVLVVTGDNVEVVAVVDRVVVMMIEDWVEGTAVLSVWVAGTTVLWLVVAAMLSVTAKVNV